MRSLPVVSLRGAGAGGAPEGGRWVGGSVGGSVGRRVSGCRQIATITLSELLVPARTLTMPAEPSP
ncbi:hypothetical protein SSP531S_06620 [Streptomyces spongiicola]|uniref:Uncharacterized protein n=1 Tax=Streptomyces spongiicola TaxID=1690221 RepID=A0A388SRL1_9ACTN|nr:hypothetical protein SSP531S_06620 [Streptomyces spongiicola]